MKEKIILKGKGERNIKAKMRDTGRGHKKERQNPLFGIYSVKLLGHFTKRQLQ